MHALISSSSGKPLIIMFRCLGFPIDAISLLSSLTLFSRETIHLCAPANSSLSSLFSGVSTCGFESHQGPFRSLTSPPPVLRDWVIKGLGMSSLVYATGHIKGPVPLIEKRRGLSPCGRFPPSFIHQVIIITGLNKLQLYVLALKMDLDADRA